MFCNKCGNELNRDDRFCAKCGNKVEYNLEETISIKNLEDAVDRLKSGEDKGFEYIYNDTYGYVYNRAKYILKEEEEALDLTHEVYLALYKNVKDIKDNSSLYGWLKTVIMRQGIKIIEKRKKNTVLSEDAEHLFDQLPDERIKIEDSYGESEDVNAVKECINQLSEEHRIVVLAYYYDNMSVKEIAEAMEISEGTVKSRLYWARKNLMSMFEIQEEKQGYKFFAAGIPALTLAFDDIIKQEVEIPECINIVSAAAEALQQAADAVDTVNVISSVTPEKVSFWTKIAGTGAKKIALATAGVLVAGGIAGGIIATTMTGNSSTEEIQPTSVVTEEEKVMTLEEAGDYYYGDFLEKYRDSEANGWMDYDTSMINEIYQMEWWQSDGLCYTFLDLADDGIPELFISDSEYHTIYDAYGISSENNPEIVKLFEDESALLGERVQCYLCENNYIRYNASGGFLTNLVEYFEMKPGTAEVMSVEGIMQDSYDMETAYYYYGNTDPDYGDFIETQEATEEDYWNLIEKYPERNDIEWKLLSEYSK